MSSWTTGTDGKKTDRILYFVVHQVSESLSSACVCVWIRTLMRVVVKKSEPRNVAGKY